MKFASAEVRDRDLLVVEIGDKNLLGVEIRDQKLLEKYK